MTKVYVVGQNRDKCWELQGVFSSHEKALAACRNDNYYTFSEDLDVLLPDESTAIPDVEWPRIYREQYAPSAAAEATIAYYTERQFHGGEPNADGGYTNDKWKIDPAQRKRYYPAALSAEWYHDSARLWAMVDDLRTQAAAPELVAEIRRMARRAYELGYMWQRGALSGQPEYASWQEEPEMPDAVTTVGNERAAN